MVVFGAFIGWVTLFPFRWLTDGLPCLEIDTDGFNDRTTMAQREKIPWSRVKSIEAHFAHHQRFIFVTLHEEPEGIIQRHDPFALLRKINKWFSHGDIGINPSMCGTTSRELLSELHDYWHAWRIEHESS